MRYGRIVRLEMATCETVIGAQNVNSLPSLRHHLPPSTLLILPKLSYTFVTPHTLQRMATHNRIHILLTHHPSRLSINCGPNLQLGTPKNILPDLLQAQTGTAFPLYSHIYHQQRQGQKAMAETPRVRPLGLVNCHLEGKSQTPNKVAQG